MVFNLYLIRHGEMPINRFEFFNEKLKDHLNDPLTRRGVAQAEAIGRSLTDVKFHKAFASNSIRTKHTAECILKESKNSVPEITVDLRIKERGIGELDERTFMEILEESKRLNINPVYIPLPGGESVEDVQKRAEEFIEDLLSSNDNSSEEIQNILVVSHAGFIGCLCGHIGSRGDLYELTGENVDQFGHKIPSNASITQFELSRKPGSNSVKHLKLIKVNDTTHLNDDELPD